MFFIKKVGFGALFYALGYVIEAFVSGILGYIGPGYHWFSLTVVAAVLFFAARPLRTAKLKKEHKGDDSPEKAIFNGEIKGKLQYVLKTDDLKLEFILSFVASLVMVLTPIFKTARAIGFVSFSVNWGMFFAMFIIVPILFFVLDILNWVLAYDGAYKRKEF